MNTTRSRLKGLAVPVKVVVQRFAFVMLIVAASAMILLGKTDTLVIERFRLILTDVSAPIVEVVSHPVAAFGGMVRDLNQIWHLRSENERLREEVERLSNWQSVARRLESENAIYKEQLHSSVEPRVAFASARVIADSGSPFVRTMLLNAGDRDGISNGQGVVAQVGLVGRIVDTGSRSSRILLVTDLNSRIPVVLEKSRHRAILVGNNSELPRLTFLNGGVMIEVGDRVATSGHGGLIPPGVPVGSVVSVIDGVAAVQPFVDLDRLEYVRILRFELPRLSGAD